MASKKGDKKQALLARKEELLREIKYYEKRIEEARNVQSSFNENDSSDSEQEFSIDIGPTITELKLQQSMLKTCLQASQELTNVQILQYEVNIMVDNPVFDGEPQITEEGTWKEVTVECRIDLVPFSMTFHAHQPKRLFAPISYRNLYVIPVKAAHEQELSKSVLHSVTTPSDATEVIRSYARAHRSRRTTLASLVERFADELYMEPVAEGGYKLKCANLLEVYWILRNSCSSIAPFQHTMKFNLEYIDESYLKIIRQAHKQLSNPAVSTDERTNLMAKIINTCLEVKKSTQDIQESLETDSDQSKRQTLDQEPEIPAVKSKDSEIMAPPKALPKKTKPKNRENSVSNTKKRSNDLVNDNSKKAKIDDSNSKNNEGTSKDDKTKKVESKNNVATSKIESKKTTNVAIAKNIEADKVKKTTVKNTETNKNNAITTQSKEKVIKTTDNTKSKTTDKDKAIQTKNNKENNLNPNQKNIEKNKQPNLSERFQKNVASNKNIASGENKKKIIENKVVSQKNFENKSKIPQKSLPFKKNHLRISPRKPQPTPSSQDSSKTSVLTATNIPRLVKKPVSKPKS